MKLTKSKLKQLIKEELEKLYSEGLTPEEEEEKEELEKELDTLKTKEHQ